MLPKSVREKAELVDKHFQSNTEQKPAAEEAKPTSVETPSEQPQVPQASTVNDDINWKQRYATLDGKYKAEVPRLSEEIRQLKSQLSATPQNDAVISQMQQEINSLKQANQLLEQQQSQPAESAIELDKQLAEDYGEDFAQGVARVAQLQNKELKQELENLKSQFNSTQQSMHQVTGEQKLSSFESMLLSKGITFAAVDNDPVFHQFLSTVDQRSGQTYQALMQSAYDNGDLARAASFYTEFSDQQSRSNPNLDQYADNLNSQTHVDTPPATPVVNGNAFTQLANDFRNKRITRAEFEAKERELFNALRAN